MKNTEISLVTEYISGDAAAVRTEMAKRAEYAEKVQQPKNAGNTVYERRGENIFITMYHRLPDDFFVIEGEQFALGAENDAYTFRLSDGYQEDFETYMEALGGELAADGMAVYPVIWHEKERRASGFPCSLRGIVSMNVAKREYGLYAACVKPVRWGTGGGGDPYPAAVQNQRLLCDYIHEKRSALIQKPEIIGEKKPLDEMDPLMKLQTFGVTPFLALAFFVAAYFSWEMQATQESGPAQTFFLAAMGVGFVVFSVYNTVIRARNIKKYNEKVRAANRSNRDVYDAAVAAEEQRYQKELSGLEK